MDQVLSFVGWVDAVGYAGGAVTLWGFYRRTMIPLRLGAIGGNVGFILFGFFAGSYPTLVLHLCLLPLNSLRLYQSLRLIREIRAVTESDEGDFQALLPFMTEERHASGARLFAKGDAPDSMIVIEKGTVHLEEIAVECGPGDVLGEIAAFTPDNARTCTAVCATDVVLHRLGNDTMLQLFYQNPRFGLSLVRLIVHRLHGNWTDAERRAKAL